jgi:hypothetical protein
LALGNAKNRTLDSLERDSPNNTYVNNHKEFRIEKSPGRLRGLAPLRTDKSPEVNYLDESSVTQQTIKAANVSGASFFASDHMN